MKVCPITVPGAYLFPFLLEPEATSYHCNEEQSWTELYLRLQQKSSYSWLQIMNFLKVAGLMRRQESHRDPRQR